MELEIGMYVRTINGKIWIIKSQQAISGHRKDIKAVVTKEQFSQMEYRIGE